MSTSGAQAAAFFRDVVRHGTVWWVRDEEGSPAPVGSVDEVLNRLRHALGEPPYDR